jgi:hypothetical protein
LVFYKIQILLRVRLLVAVLEQLLDDFDLVIVHWRCLLYDLLLEGLVVKKIDAQLLVKFIEISTYEQLFGFFSTALLDSHLGHLEVERWHNASALEGILEDPKELAEKIWLINVSPRVDLGQLLLLHFQSLLQAEGIVIGDTLAQIIF